jgi:hypothetical protein
VATPSRRRRNAADCDRFDALSSESLPQQLLSTDFSTELTSQKQSTGELCEVLILDVPCSTTLEGSDGNLCEQIARWNTGDLWTLAADKGYDKNVLRERLRELGIRPLIKHCIRAPYDYAHNARIDENLYAQRSMTETVNSAVKRPLGYAVRARDWYREFREIALMCVVYNIKRSIK